MAYQDLEREGKFRSCSNGSSSSNGESVTEETSLLSSEGKGSPTYQSTDGTDDEAPSEGDKNEGEKPMGKSVLGILSLLMLGETTFSRENC